MHDIELVEYYFGGMTLILNQIKLIEDDIKIHEFFKDSSHYN